MPPPLRTGSRASELTSKTSRARNGVERSWQKIAGQLRYADATWRYSRPFRADDPTQGWKLHISATPLSASATLSRVLPILREADALFKVPRSLVMLIQLNSGLPQYSQIGKFLTVYPRSTAEAVKLAAALHTETVGLPGPQIPFDERYRRNSSIYYRYGEFRGGRKKGGVIRDPTGKVHRDRRAPGSAVPSWLVDPFRRQRPRRRRLHGPIGRDYLAFKALAQRGKGGVYEAIDLSVKPARLVILKEGRAQGEVDFSGRDGFARVQHEERILWRLRRAGVKVPEVFAGFTQDKRRYLVLEKLAGRPLLSQRQLQPSKPSWRRAEKIFLQLGCLLEEIHAAGWVWRDCKPSHIFVHRGSMSVIDFEGSCRIADVEPTSWGSPNYTPPGLQTASRRNSGTWEDDYALGVIAFQFFAGKFPPPTARGRAPIYNRARCPDSLRDRIESLLRH